MDRNEIINRRFSHAFFGYDVTEVDGFLDEIIREMDRMNNELDILELRAQASRQREESLKTRIERLNEKLAQANIVVEDELTADDAAALIEKATLEARENAESAWTEEAVEEIETALNEAEAEEASEVGEGAEQLPVDMEEEGAHIAAALTRKERRALKKAEKEAKKLSWNE